MKTLKFVATGLFLFLFLLSCNTSDLDEQGNPKVLKIGVTTSTEDMQEVFRKMEPVRLYLERQLGVPVRYFKVNGYAPVIEALKSKKIHVGSLSPFAYLIARERADVSPLYCLGLPSGNQLAEYQACILSRKGSGLETIDDIKARASELTLVFVDPASSSGHIAPRHYLLQHGLEPDRDFRRVIFANNHTSAILTLKSGKVDISCNQVSTVKLLERQGQIDRNDFNFVWVSESLPSTTTCIRNDVNPQFKEKLIQAYLNIKNDTVAWGSIRRSRMANYTGSVPLDSLAYIRVTDTCYNHFKEMVKSIKNLKVDF